MSNYAALRDRMIERQIVRRGLDDPALLAAFGAVPRECFVASGKETEAYADRALPIAAGQTISQPYIVALMIHAAAIGPGDRVLEVGAGSGYAAAVIGRIAGDVVAVERIGDLASAAAERMARLGYSNVHVVEGDGTLGWPECEPYNAILVAASGSRVPPALLDQLRPGGRLVMPIGGQHWAQQLIKLTKSVDGTIEREHLAAVQFVPLIEP